MSKARQTDQNVSAPRALLATTPSTSTSMPSFKFGRLLGIKLRRLLGIEFRRLLGSKFRRLLRIKGNATTGSKQPTSISTGSGQLANMLPSQPIERSMSRDRFTVDGNRLAEVRTAVEGTRLAFQNLCNGQRLCQAEVNSRDVLNLDISLQALGNVINILDEVVSDGARIQLVDSLLATSIPISASGNHTLFADAIIADMHNLEARLVDVQGEISHSSSQNSPTLVQLFPHGEALSVRIMIDKYRSIISEACSGQIMCVITSWKAVDVLMISRATTASISNTVDNAIAVIAEMREEMKIYKQMDKGVIMRA
jgi:hypothetical protein